MAMLNRFLTEKNGQLRSFSNNFNVLPKPRHNGVSRVLYQAPPPSRGICISAEFYAVGLIRAIPAGEVARRKLLIRRFRSPLGKNPYSDRGPKTL